MNRAFIEVPIDINRNIEPYGMSHQSHHKKKNSKKNDNNNDLLININSYVIIVINKLKKGNSLNKLTLISISEGLIESDGIYRANGLWCNVRCYRYVITIID